MQKTLNQFGPLVGRVLIAAIFLLSGVGKISGFAGTAGYMASKGLPMAEILLAITIFIEIAGALMLITGFRARLAAFVFFLWLIPVTILFHNFWAAPADQAMVQQIMFLKNLAIMGAMLYIATFGPGPLSINNK